MSFEKAGKLQVLTSAAVIPWNLGLGANAVVTLTVNGTLANPARMVPGTDHVLKVVQDATGGWALMFGTAYKFDNDAVPAIGTAAGQLAVLEFWTDGTFMYLTGFAQDVTP